MSHRLGKRVITTISIPPFRVDLPVLGRSEVMEHRQVLSRQLQPHMQCPKLPRAAVAVVGLIRRQEARVARATTVVVVAAVGAA